MSQFRALFEKLNELYKSNELKWFQIAELHEKESELNRNETGTENGTMNIMSGDLLTDLSFVRGAIKNPEPHLSTMMELCTTIRALRGDERTKFFEMHDCWKEILEVTSQESYLSYIYALAGLGSLNLFKKDHIKLSMSAISTYFLSLTIPGAKGFKIFDEDVIGHCLQIFALTERIQRPDVERQLLKHQSMDIWINLIKICEDLKILLQYVHFKDLKNVRDNIMKKLIDILRLNHDHGFANIYASNLHTNCFEIFDELVNAHNGDPEETLSKLLSLTMHLHAYPPKPKPPPGGFQISNTNCEHISDWFINCIPKNSSLFVKILNQYIEFVLVNPVKTWKTEQIQRALDYAAKYDAALFSKCNESCLRLIDECIYAEEVTIRSRTVELMERILRVDSSEVHSQILGHEVVSDIPREVHIIKELIDCIRDNNNTVKLRAVQALQSALLRGSTTAKKIISECIKFLNFDTTVILPLEPPIRRNEIRYERPIAHTVSYTFNGHGLVELSFVNLPENIYDHIFQSSISNLRRSGIALMENLILLNPLIIFETKFVGRMLQFAKDPTALVRKQALQTLDELLKAIPCYPIVWIWCKIIEPMFNDADPKNTELAINCFHTRVLLNVQPSEQSNKAEHFLPWLIIRTMISISPRLYLQKCFDLSLKQNLVNSKIVSIIESHLLSSNSLEAWIILNFLSGKIKSKEPDALIHIFLSLPSWNKQPNAIIALEVLASCINNFSETALNHAFNHILKGIQDGETLPVLISKSLDFLIIIDRHSEKQFRKSSSSSSSSSRNLTSIKECEWIIKLDEHLERCILQGIEEFPSHHSNLISYLYAYSEINAMTNKRANPTIVDFVQKYTNACLKIPENNLDSENVRILDCMITIMGRFSLHDPTVVASTCRIYDCILKTMNYPPIINTIIVAITDICQKHTQAVECIIERVLEKLFSSFIINRLETFKCFEKLVLQDQLKLRDNILLSLLMVLLDDNEELVLRATRFFTEFTSKKNATLFHKCLMEYPYVLNEYKNFRSKDNFSEKRIKSKLKGESQRKKRQILYNHFMTTMDEVNLIMYFNQLKFIAEKCKTDEMITTKAGFEVIRDVFFILKRVCQLTKEKKSSSENRTNTDGKGDDDLAEITELIEPTTTAAANPTSVALNATQTGRGRRRRDIVTMDDALVILEKSLVFIPAIFKHISPLDIKAEEYFSDLCVSLIKRFPNYIKDAQNKEFWSKYKTVEKTTNKSSSQKRKSNSKPQEEEEDAELGDDTAEDNEVETLNDIGDQCDDSDSDDLPSMILHRKNQPTPSKRIRIQRQETLMEYVFNPNI